MKKFVSMALAGAAAIAATSGAQAAVTFTASSVTAAYSGAPTGDLHKTSAPTVSVNNALLTPQTITGKFSNDPSTTVNLFGYCVDIFQTSGTATFTVKTLGDYLGNTTKFNQIASLIAAEGTNGTKLHDAAVQLAVWELMNETPSNGYNINKVGNAGQFWVDDVSNAGLLASTNSFLSNAVANAGNPLVGYNFYVLQSSTKQDFLYWTYEASSTPAVPEPTTWAMMVLGLGAVGHSMRSSRRRTAVAFS